MRGYATDFHRHGDDGPDALRRLDKVPIGEVSVARRSSVPPMPQQLDRRRNTPQHRRRTLTCRSYRSRMLVQPTLGSTPSIEEVAWATLETIPCLSYST